MTLAKACQSSDTMSNSETAPDVAEAEKWFKRVTGKGDLSQQMYNVYCWSMECEYPAAKHKFEQDIVALNTQLALEEEIDDETKALLVGEIYSEAFDAVVMQKTNVQLPAFIGHLGTSLSKEVTRFNPTKLHYSALRVAVHETVRDYDAATRVDSAMAAT